MRTSPFNITFINICTCCIQRNLFVILSININIDLFVVDFVCLSSRLCEPLRLRRGKPQKLLPEERSDFKLNKSKPFSTLSMSKIVNSVSNIILHSFQNWKKFGNSEYDAPGPNVATTTVSDDVFMTFISSKEVRVLLFCVAAFVYCSNKKKVNYGVALHLYLMYLFHFVGLKCPRPGWRSDEQTERTEDRVLSYLQRWSLDYTLSVQGHPGPNAEGAGWTARAFYWRQGEACWFRYHEHTIHIVKFLLSDVLLRFGVPKVIMTNVACFSFHQRSQSLHSLHRARLGSMFLRAWGMEAPEEGSLCSLTAEVGAHCLLILFTPVILWEIAIGIIKHGCNFQVRKMKPVQQCSHLMAFYCVATRWR